MPSMTRKLGAAARDQQRARHRRDGEQRQRQPDQKPDLGLRHVQFFVDQRNHRRHGQDRHAHGNAGEPEQAEKTEGAGRRRGGFGPGREAWVKQTFRVQTASARPPRRESARPRSATHNGLAAWACTSLHGLTTGSRWLGQACTGLRRPCTAIGTKIERSRRAWRTKINTAMSDLAAAQERLRTTFGFAAIPARPGRDRRRHSRRPRRAGGDADRQRQVALLPASGADARRAHRRGVAADRADAQPGGATVAATASRRRA